MIVFPRSALIPVLLIGCAKTCFGGVVTARTVLASQQPLAHTDLASPGGTGVTTRNGNDNQNEAIGQVVFSEALSGDEIDLQTLYLKTSQTGNDITIPSNGVNELEIWLGVWGDDAPGETIYTETFDVAGITFENSTIYSFTFDNTFDIWDENNPDQDYAFQIWWTDDDNIHQLGWEIDTGQGFVDGAFVSDTGSEVSLPFEDKVTGNSDLYFAFSEVPEPSSLLLITAGLLLFAGRRTR